MSTISRSLQISTLAVALALVVGITACGDSDSGAEDGAANKDSTTVQRATGDEQQIKALLATLQDSYVTGHGESLCSNLTNNAKRELERYGRMIDAPGPCPAVVKSMATTAKQAGLQQARSRVLSLRVQGNRATALVKDGARDPVRMRFVKVNDRWLLPSLGIGDALGG